MERSTDTTACLLGNATDSNVRYYFDIDDHRQISEHEGSEHHNIESARQYALRLAERVGQDGTRREHRGSFVRVVDEKGVEVFRAQIRSVVAPHSGLPLAATFELTSFSWR
jgi:hypothetical protein